MAEGMVTMLGIAGHSAMLQCAQMYTEAPILEQQQQSCRLRRIIQKYQLDN